MLLPVLLLLLNPCALFAQSGFRTDIGHTTVYNFEAYCGLRPSVGEIDRDNFSDGSSTPRNLRGSHTGSSGSTPCVNGSTNRRGGTMVGNGADGTMRTHQPIGSTTVHHLRDGRNGTSRRVGLSTSTHGVIGLSVTDITGNSARAIMQGDRPLLESQTVPLPGHNPVSPDEFPGFTEALRGANPLPSASPTTVSIQR